MKQQGLHIAAPGTYVVDLLTVSLMSSGKRALIFRL